MNSYAKNLAGIGFREQQITVEIMKKMHLNNVEIFASPNSYIFHRKCGFMVTPNKFLMAKEKFMDFLISYAKEFGIKSEKLKELMIFSTENKNFVDQGKTFEEVTNYAISQKKELPSQIYMPMHLSKNAINEWSCFINYQPILS